MLILSRKVGEKIRIGDSVVITVKEICGNQVRIEFSSEGCTPIPEIMIKEIRRNQVRIGINVPKEVPVFREEIYIKRKEDQTK